MCFKFVSTWFQSCCASRARWASGRPDSSVCEILWIHWKLLGTIWNSLVSFVELNWVELSWIELKRKSCRTVVAVDAETSVKQCGVDLVDLVDLRLWPEHQPLSLSGPAKAKLSMDATNGTPTQFLRPVIGQANNFKSTARLSTPWVHPARCQSTERLRRTVGLIHKAGAKREGHRAQLEWCKMLQTVFQHSR